MKDILSEPHLHMEIRCTDTGELIDPLQFYTDKIKDTTPPRASMIMSLSAAGRWGCGRLTKKKIHTCCFFGATGFLLGGKIAAGIKGIRLYGWYT